MLCHNIQLWRAILIVLALVLVSVVTAAIAPISNCYALDTDDHLYDLTSFCGKEFEFVAESSTYVLRFCKDFQERSQSGYISFGSFEEGYPLSPTPPGSNFVQEYRHGDLKACENYGSEFDGRSTQVSVICGKCPKQNSCKDPAGCICSVSLDTSSNSCVASVVLAISCPERGPRVLKGFTIGFSPRGKEVVENGITQWGFESDKHEDYSFETTQSTVFMYFSAPSGVAKAIGKPSFSVTPANGLEVYLLGTAAGGEAPTTLTPSILEIDWRCESAGRYLVTITVPVEGYDPVVLSLLKECESKQSKEQNGSNGWATFGIFSCILMVMMTTCCCAGFLYRTRVEEKHGLDAVPGIGLLASCLDLVNRDTGGYRRPDEATTIIGARPFRDGASTGTRTGQRGSDGNYGAV